MIALAYIPTNETIHSVGYEAMNIYAVAKSTQLSTLLSIINTQMGKQREFGIIKQRTIHNLIVA